MKVEDKIKDIIVKELGVKPEEVTPEAELVRDLEMDSLDSVELIMAIEEEFNIEICDEDASKMKKIRDITDYLTKKLSEQ